MPTGRAPYPEQFYDDDRFGLWDLKDPRVEYRCKLILHRLELARDFGDAAGPLLNRQLEWDADRCLCDNTRWDDAKKNLAYHWHTAQAAQAIDGDDMRSVVFEHAIPRKVVFDGLRQAFSAGDIKTWDQVRDYLKPRRAIALVHKDEDALLTKKWRQTVPAPTKQGGQTVDASARYSDLGIELLPPRGVPMATASIFGDVSPRRRKLNLIDYLFDRQAELGLPSDYCRVGATEDKEWQSQESGGQELTDSLALACWLPATRRTVPWNSRTDGYATGLPIVVWFDMVAGNLVLNLGRGYMDDLAMTGRVTEELAKRSFRMRNGATSKHQLDCRPLPAAGGDITALLARALADIRPRLDEVTIAMRAAGVLP